jgi:hypothetical protein
MGRPLTPDLRERFERLLRDLHEWENEDDRRVLLRGILRYHPVWDFLHLKGGVAIAADAVLDTCEEQDPESLCVLLAGLREKYKPSRCAARRSISLRLVSAAETRGAADHGRAHRTSVWPTSTASMRPYSSDERRSSGNWFRH